MFDRGIRAGAGQDLDAGIGGPGLLDDLTGLERFRDRDVDPAGMRDVGGGQDHGIGGVARDRLDMLLVQPLDQLGIGPR